MKSWLHPITFVLSTAVLSTALSAIPATALSPEQQVQQGIDHYQSGDYTNAIATWKAALTTYKQTAQPDQTATVLENLARVHQQMGQIKEAIDYWDQLLELYKTKQPPTQFARILTEKAQALTRQGKSQAAIALLCDLKNFTNVKQCQQDTESGAIGLAHKHGDLKTETAALGSLGEAYRLKGNYQEAEQILKLTLTMADQQTDRTFQIAANNSLGNTYSNLALTRYRRAMAFQIQDPTKSQELEAKGKEYDQQALQHYQNSTNLAQFLSSPTDRLKAQLKAQTNLIPIYFRLEKPNQAQQTWEQATQLLNQLSNSRSRATAYSAIDLAKALQPIPLNIQTPEKESCISEQNSTQAETLLQQGLKIAEKIQDNRAKSFALGELGNLAECRQNNTLAMAYFRDAVLASEQNLTDRDSLYLWEWRRGRLLAKLDKTDEAIQSYKRSIAILDSVRGEIVNIQREVIKRDAQFDFRETIEPIYRELITLQLKQIEPQPSQRATQKPIQIASLRSDLPLLDQPKTSPTLISANLGNTLATLDGLRLAELQNYFGNDCVIQTSQNRIDEKAPQDTAILTTVIGESRTAVILSLPNGKRDLKWIELPRSQVEQTVKDYQSSLRKRRLARFSYIQPSAEPQPAETLYEWLITPFKANLPTDQIKTLVFVHDGIFRTVPMAALLNDGQYLIEKYAIATAPSLSGIEIQANRKNPSLLALGYSKGRTTDDGKAYPELPQVPIELKNITALFPRSKTLSEDSFSIDQLSQELQKSNYSILHIATHGQFGTDPEDTYILTGDREPNKQRLNLNRLDLLIRETSKNTELLDLLVLTACETAVGDDRSALGLAGVAVQAGARSAIASLWQVDDEATAQLATAFYTNLQNTNNLTKAESLRQAQISLLKDPEKRHPYYWSAFLLVGNWK